MMTAEAAAAQAAGEARGSHLGVSICEVGKESKKHREDAKVGGRRRIVEEVGSRRAATDNDCAV